MKVPPYLYLAIALIWLGIAIDRLFFFHPGTMDVTYLALLIGVVSLGQFVWVKMRARPNVRSGSVSDGLNGVEG